MKRRTIIWIIVILVLLGGTLWWIQARQEADRGANIIVMTARQERHLTLTAALATADASG